IRDLFSFVDLKSYTSDLNLIPQSDSYSETVRWLCEEDDDGACGYGSIIRKRRGFQIACTNVLEAVHICSR
nr:hypothetical protein [Tanacetum cinerariifolium]